MEAAPLDVIAADDEPPCDDDDDDDDVIMLDDADCPYAVDDEPPDDVIESRAVAADAASSVPVAPLDVRDDVTVVELLLVRGLVPSFDSVFRTISREITFDSSLRLVTSLPNS